MQANSLHRLTINWTDFRSRVLAESAAAQTLVDARLALSDGAVLTLTTALMADRHQTTYGDSIAPDELITDSSQVVTRAIAWLRSGTHLTSAAR